MNLSSWKTTAGGIGSLLTGVGVLIECFTSGNWDAAKIGVAFTAISGGIGLLFARDNTTTSEQAGVK